MLFVVCLSSLSSYIDGGGVDYHDDDDCDGNGDDDNENMYMFVRSYSHAYRLTYSFLTTFGQRFPTIVSDTTNEASNCET